MKTKIYTLDSPLDFGKYYGFTVKELIDGTTRLVRPSASMLVGYSAMAADLVEVEVKPDHTYLQWLVDHVDTFILSADALTYAAAQEVFTPAQQATNRRKAELQQDQTVAVADLMTSILPGRQREHEAYRPVATHLRAYDSLLGGGLLPGTLNIIAARPAMGKSALLLNLARNISRDGKRVIYFSIDQSRDDIGRRLLLMSGLLSHDDLVDKQCHDMNSEQIDQLYAYIDALSQTPLEVNDKPRWNIDDFVDCCRQAHASRGVDVIMVDYLQLFGSADAESRDLAVQAVVRAMKSLARELQIPVVVLSQLSRSVETRGGSKIPQLSDLRESGAIEQEADTVTFLYRPEYYGIDEDDEGYTQGKADLFVAKNRSGSLGRARVDFDGAHLLFSDTPLIDIFDPANAPHDVFGSRFASRPHEQRQDTPMQDDDNPF